MSSEVIRETVLLSLHDGNIEGFVEVFEEHHVNTFLGIPYAKPPIGNLRFEPLEPLGKWTGVLKATNPPNACYQSKTDWLFSTDNEMSEDCIYANVWAPQSKTKNLDVMVFIHGGGFQNHSGFEKIYNFGYFAASQNIICISFNYRLDVLGFLSIDGVIEHNLGLKDQQFALRWIRNNCSFFGGNTESITIVGGNSGGASVNYHLTLPNSVEYFQKAAILSGSFYASWANVSLAGQQSMVRKALKLLGCKERTAKEILRFLKELPLENFERILSNHRGNQLRWRPVDVTNMIHRHNYSIVSDKSLLIGMVSQEGDMIVNYRILGTVKDVNRLGSGREKSSLKDDELNRNQESTFAWLRKSISNWYSHFFFDRPMNRTIDFITKYHNDVPIYKYVFDYNGPTRNSTIPKLTFSDWCGCTHSYDLFYIFGAIASNPSKYTEEEVTVAKNMMKFMGNFVKSGVPSSSWPKYNRQLKQYKRIRNCSEISETELDESNNLFETNQSIELEYKPSHVCCWRLGMCCSPCFLFCKCC
uniref:Acetylcholinesterase 4 n=1 Tax=Hofstenia miamia TaxID=442651 RepID=A0A7G7LK71_HOFMI|nr:acetylcholinesterase 4 [Hofstenia miamia]